jgi:hypothetical protein
VEEHETHHRRGARVKHPDALREEETKVYTHADIGKEEIVQPNPEYPPVKRILEFIDKDGHPHFSYPDMKGIQGTDAVDLAELDDEGRAKQARTDFSLRGGANSHRTATPQGPVSSESSSQSSRSSFRANDVMSFVTQLLSRKEARSDGGHDLRVVVDLNVRIHSGVLSFNLD